MRLGCWMMYSKTREAEDWPVRIDGSKAMMVEDWPVFCGCWMVLRGLGSSLGFGREGRLERRSELLLEL